MTIFDDIIIILREYLMCLESLKHTSTKEQNKNVLNPRIKKLNEMLKRIEK